MILSKRERYIVIFSVAAVGLLIGDRYILSPLLAARTRLDSEIRLVRADKMDPAMNLLDNKPRTDARWNEMLAAGLKSDASSAESQILKAVESWARDAGINLSSLKPERTEQEKPFHKITFRATGTGTLAGLTRFIQRAQSASIPVRISDIQINPRKEQTDDLVLQIGISTLYLIPEAEKPVRPATPAGAREVRP